MDFVIFGPLGMGCPESSIQILRPGTFVGHEFVEQVDIGTISGDLWIPWKQSNLLHHEKRSTTIKGPASSVVKTGQDHAEPVWVPTSEYPLNYVPPIANAGAYGVNTPGQLTTLDLSPIRTHAMKPLLIIGTRRSGERLLAESPGAPDNLPIFPPIKRSACEGGKDIWSKLGDLARRIGNQLFVGRSHLPALCGHNDSFAGKIDDDNRGVHSTHRQEEKCRKYFSEITTGAILQGTSADARKLWVLSPSLDVQEYISDDGVCWKPHF
ncbi:MAG: hypothetical protein ABIR70_07130 [Bryobacteraceae bacterium]